MEMLRRVSSALLALLLSWLLACAGGGGAGKLPGVETDTPPAVVAGSFGLPSPAQALARAAAPRSASSAVLVRQGCEFEDGLAHLVTADGLNARVDPAWTDNTSPSTAIAYAIYRFNLHGYTRDSAARTPARRQPV